MISDVWLIASMQERHLQWLEPQVVCPCEVLQCLSGSMRFMQCHCTLQGVRDLVADVIVGVGHSTSRREHAVQLVRLSFYLPEVNWARN